MVDRENNKAYRILKGNHLRKNVILSTVSGVATTKEELVRLFDRSVKDVDIITTKSFQVVPTTGNTPPVVVSPEEGDYGNSVGLRNPGMDYAFKYLGKLRNEGFSKILNISLAASNVDDFITLVKKFDPIADMLELNFSCPHAAKGFGASIGSDENLIREYVESINKAYPERKSLLIVKLSPNVPSIARMAEVAISSGSDGVAAINTVGPREYYLDGHEILHNALGGKGGASGEWVKDIAFDAIRDIRERIGDEPIILSMGGMSRAEDVRKMIDLGADSVGIGSALSRIAPENWDAYFTALKNGGDVGKYFTLSHKNLEYEKHYVKEKIMYSDDIVVLTLDGKGTCKAGEFVFLFIPGLGERPFSVAKNDPLSFIIRVKGPFTEGVKNIKQGDEIYIRGLSGSPLSVKKAKKALLIAGGTGTVVLNLLAEELKKNGTEMEFRIGMQELGSSGKGLMQDELEKYGKYEVVLDDGKPGRVLDTISPSDISPDNAYYIVGPTVMMKKGAEKLLSLGAKAEEINISVETMTMCGIGMCGECVVGSHLPCRQGTFLTWEYIAKNKVDF